jgi:hypothetical protein
VPGQLQIGSAVIFRQQNENILCANHDAAPHEKSIPELFKASLRQFHPAPQQAAVCDLPWPALPNKLVALSFF